MKALAGLVALLLPVVAHADWSVTPPKGWKRSPFSTVEKLKVSAAQLVGGAGGAKLDAWESPTDKNQTLVVIHVTLREVDEPPIRIVDGMLVDLTKQLASSGLQSQESIAPKVRGQAVATRLLAEAGGLGDVVHAQARAVAKGKGARVVLVVCADNAMHDDCERPMASIKLR